MHRRPETSTLHLHGSGRGPGLEHPDLPRVVYSHHVRSQLSCQRSAQLVGTNASTPCQDVGCALSAALSTRPTILTSARRRTISPLPPLRHIPRPHPPPGWDGLPPGGTVASPATAKSPVAVGGTYQQPPAAGQATLDLWAAARNTAFRLIVGAWVQGRGPGGRE